MLTQKPKNISESIIQLFRIKQDYTAKELLPLVKAEYGKCSERALYKQLGLLIEAGVIVRTGTRYSVSLTWVLSLMSLGEELYDSIVSEHLQHDYLPLAGAKRTWRFRDLQHLDRFWIEMIFLLFESSKSRQMYVWVPFFWFDLVHYHKDLEAQAAMKKAGNKMFMMLGEDSYLTRLPEKYWSREVYEWSYAPGPFVEEDNLYYDVIDDYVMTIELTPKTTRRIQELFNDVTGPEDLKQIGRFEAIKSNAPVTLTIEHNPKKARKMLRQFQEYFG